MSTAVQRCARLILADNELPAWLLQFELRSAILVTVRCQCLAQATQADSGPGGARGFFRDANRLGQHRPAPAVPKTMHTNLRKRHCCVYMMLTQMYARLFPRRFSVEEAVAAA